MSGISTYTELMNALQNASPEIRAFFVTVALKTNGDDARFVSAAVALAAAGCPAATAASVLDTSVPTLDTLIAAFTSELLADIRAERKRRAA